MRNVQLVCMMFFAGPATAPVATTKSDYSLSPNFSFEKTYRVALVTKGGKALYREAFNELSLQVMKVGNLSVIERESVSELLAEQEFGLSGTVDPTTASAIGELLGADLIGVVDVMNNGASLYIKLVDAASGEVLYVGQGVGYDLNSSAYKAVEPLVKRAKEGD